MNFQQLRYARALFECRSFVEAAKKCAVTQPTLSNGLAQLEAELGQPLFARTTRSVEPTEFGDILLPSILDVLNAQAALVAKARSLTHPARALIRVGVSPIISFRIVEMIVETFRRFNPEVEVIFREINLSEMFRLLDAGQLEFVIGPVDPDAKLPADWNCIQFHEEPLFFVGNASGKIPADFVRLKDISDETFIMVPDTCGLARVTRSIFRRNRIRLKEYAGEAMSYGVLQDWAQLGLGAAILPASKVAGAHRPFVALGRSNAPINIAYCAYWRAKVGKASPVATFATFLKEASTSIASGLYTGGNPSGSIS